MNDIGCEIARDIMPLYIDKLTSSETNAALEAHIAHCEECRKLLEEMREPENGGGRAENVDFLKKLRTRGIIKSAGIALAAVVILAAVLVVRIFFIGTEADMTRVSCSATVDGGVRFEGMFTDGNECVGIDFGYEDGTVDITLKSAPASIFHSNAFSEKREFEGEIRQVRANGIIIWEDGIDISRAAAAVYEAKNPYVGDISSDIELANALGISAQLGGFTNELRTNGEHYGWVIKLLPEYDFEDEEGLVNIMTADSYVLLAGIGNLGYVEWQYTTGGARRAVRVTRGDADKYVGGDIKACMTSAAGTQRLMDSLSVKWSGMRETPLESGEFKLCFINYTDRRFIDMSVAYYLDGEAIGTSTAMNADGTTMDGEEALIFSFADEDFPSGTDGWDIAKFSFDFEATLEDGTVVTIAKNVPVAAKYAWMFFFSLSEDDSGLKLTEG